jgi:membrane protein YqaA with SNARE-associated domain
MGWAALQAVHPGRAGWLSRHLERFGPKMLLLAWLPVVGDPLCTLGGWLRLPFWPSLGYMALGKFLRYLLITTLLLHVPNGFWHWLADSLS